VVGASGKLAVVGVDAAAVLGIVGVLGSEASPAPKDVAAKDMTVSDYYKTAHMYILRRVNYLLDEVHWQEVVRSSFLQSPLPAPRVRSA
jgi:hypothetical protein